MSVSVALCDDPVAKDVGHFGKVADLFFNAEDGVFSGIVRHRRGELIMTTPIALEPELRSVKVLVSTVRGWLTGEEMEVLYQEAQNTPAGHVIVEIGSFCGRSTICLGWGSRLGNNVTVYAVDPHTGSREHQGFMAGSLGSLPHLKANIKRADLEGLVKPLATTSEAALIFVSQPVGLIFIDGDHEKTHEDMLLWYDRIVQGGRILFHDSVGGNWPKVEEDVQRAVDGGLIRVLDQAGSVTVAEKTGKGLS